MGCVRSSRKRRFKVNGMIRPVVPRVVGESGWNELEFSECMIRRFARQNSLRPTPAERHLHRILSQLNGGAMKDRFRVQHPISGRRIVDFFFPEVRLAIEVDGSVHLTDHQLLRDRRKDLDCQRFDITVVRLKNKDVFGDRDKLVELLRAGWRGALKRENQIIGRPLGSREGTRTQPSDTDVAHLTQRCAPMPRPEDDKQPSGFRHLSAQCGACRSQRSLTLSDDELFRLENGAKLRCDCGGRAIQCSSCNYPVQPKRLATFPSTRFCGKCANERVQKRNRGGKKRRI
ncbi:MAG: hypothetical protein K0R27_749 [Xanthobacteraceae bacterium]|jgi:very-short-patch-repair endonuclease|nr:hypothetical protein [Xanthobacteraceae bacterium]